MVRMAAATISSEPLGTLASTLRRKWTRQRWTAAPAMIASTAWRSPRWASAMTSCTPSSPRALSDAQELRPERAILAVTHGEAEHFAAAVAAHPGGITTAWATTRRLTRALQ